MDVLTADAEKRGLADKITTLTCSINDLLLKEGSLDIIWAEGGILVASDITWLTQIRPREITDHWNAEYPEIATAAEKIQILVGQGFMLKGYLPLPQSCWIENYHIPLENSFDTFLAKHDSGEAQAIVDGERTEIALYKEYRDYYSYGLYITQKT